nr:ethanolamine ammonia-lyase light chain EutC [Aliiruegeria sabulilitoris]
MRARLVIMLGGARLGLTVADSLGAYLTCAPHPGRRNSERYCISNIHTHGGLDYAGGARKIAVLSRQAFRLGPTGTGLKENADSDGMLADPVSGA